METTTPDLFQGPYYTSQFTQHDKRQPADGKNATAAAADHFIVEDLLDFPNDEVAGGGMVAANASSFDVAAAAVTGGASTDSSTATAFDTSCNSSSGSTHDAQFTADIACCNLTDGPFSGEFVVPCEDMAELEWLSNFVEESFSSEDLQKLQLISGMKARNEESSQVHHFQREHNPKSGIPTLRLEMAVPAKARSKRSRAAPCNGTSRLMVVSPSTNTVPTTTTTQAISSSSESDIASSSGKKTVKAALKKKEAVPRVVGGVTNNNSEGRKCLHCATDKTPQWRTGPLGPKTLCNACGVRYKSGRLVPEYRPAASPTFVLTKHSNSHRKVLEIRRQKEFLRAQQQQQFLHQKMMFDVSNGDDYLIHQHIGPHFRQLI